MGFKKVKVSKSDKEFIDLAEIKQKISKVKKINFISGIILGFFSILIIASIFGVVFAKTFNLNFNIGSVVNFIPGVNVEQKFGKEKINFLVVGRGGYKNDAPDLTDTIILTSVNIKEKTVSMLSVPRDLYVKYPDGLGIGKINDLYRLGKKKNGEDKGFELLKEKISEITGEEIDHYVNIDFEGFIKLVDLIDGIEVDVPDDLIDTQYPDWNWGYTTFKVKKGLQTFDGETALKYARSRHSTNDFDRSARQQIVIKAIKNKLLTLKYLGNPSKIKSLYSIMSANLKTDLNINQMIDFAALMKNMEDKKMLSFNLSDACLNSLKDCQPGAMLYVPQRELFGGASVVIPDLATPSSLSEYSQIQRFSDIVYNYPKFFVENYEISIINTIKVSNLAYTKALDMRKFGFNIPDSSYLSSSKENLEETKIYYMWDEETKTGISPESETIKVLENFFLIKPEATKDLTKFPNSFSKVSIFLGKDYKKFSN